MTRRAAVVVHDLPQARAALGLEAAGQLSVTLVSAPDASRHAGVGFLHALEVRLGRVIVVDCGGDAGLVMAGLRAGLRSFLFTGSADTRARLADMARQLGGEVLSPLDLPEPLSVPGGPPAAG
ncbi:MAG TPA: hypothetical protein PKA13_11845 [Geminicoccaceae bacterium]|nr:hypothetical protein [Geminicoccus sp.]HMU50459.1 hypothetical protein [Geminicoccaceae bacterium]